MSNVLGPEAVAFFEGRGISGETAVSCEVYTPSRGPNKVVVIAFPYIDGGVVVAEKFRTLDKRFWQRPGGKKTFWNADILDDPAIENGTPVIITEGECDALAVIESGNPFVVSVPDGAPPPTGKLAPIDPATEASGKFEYVFNNRDRIKRAKKFIIAVDNDAPGQRLAAELVRRLLASRCSFVEYPEGCKDLNDVLVKHGPQGVSLVLNRAKPYPVRGLYELGDYAEVGPLETFTTHWQTLDPHLKMFRGEFMVVTGIPSHGKSTWVLNLLAGMASSWGWRAAVFSPEMPALPYMRGKLRRIHGACADPWIAKHFFFIDSDPVADDDTSFDLDWIIDRATDAVLKYGIDVLVIDPWNEVEHARGPNESLTEYVGRSIRALKRFARLRNVAVIVIAHPNKDVSGKDGVRTPTLYDISDSAHWHNKADHGVIIERDDDDATTTIHVAKSRFEEAGERGSVKMRFDRETSRYEMLSEL